MIARLLSLALGLWLMAAPAVLNYGPPLATSDRIIGPLIATVSIIAISEATRGLRWVPLPAGLWLVTSPLVMSGYDLTMLFHHALVGLGLAALAFSGGDIQGRYGGGWSALWADEKEAGS